MKRLTSVVLAFAAPLLSQDPRLVVDANPAGSAVGGFPFLGRASAPASRLLALDDGVRGTELWRTDGTASGTVLVREFVPGPAGASFGFGSITGSITMFVVDRGAGDELWRSDGTTTGTQFLFDAARLGGVSMGAPQTHPGLGGDWFFVLDGVLWRTDGTAVGSSPLPIGAAALASVLGNTAYVFEFATGNVHLVQGTSVIGTVADALVWETPDGEPLLYRELTSASGVQTTEVRALARPGTPPAVITGHLSSLSGQGASFPQWRSGTLYWTDDQSRLFAWDLVAAPRLLHANAGVVGLEVQGRVLFEGTDAAAGTEPWVTDGTAAGTSVLDFTPGPASTAFRFAFGLPASGRALLWMDRGAIGSEPWSTDGTVAGTVSLGDLEPGLAGSLPEFPFGSMGAVGERRHVQFVRTATRGCELWLTDGTPAGSRWLAEVRPGPLDGVDPFQSMLAACGHRYVFTADDGVRGRELWSIDLEGSTSRLEAQGSRSLDVRGDAVLGASVEFASEGLQATDLGAVAVGLPAVQATRVGANGTWLFVDLATSLPYVLIAPNAQGAWSQTIAVPNDAALQGLALVAQAGFAGPTIPGGVEFATAWWLCLGR